MLGNLRRLWLSRYQQYIALEADAQNINHRIQSLSKFIRYSQQSLMLGAGALLVIRGELNAGAMIAANVLMGRCLAPIDTIVGTWSSWLSARKSFERLEALLQEHPVRPSGVVFDDPRGAARVENLVATATNRQQPILSDLTLDFPAGEIVAIVGPSGSGKSTLARCLVGVWPEVKGKVLLDGKSINTLDREELGPFLGYLPQDIELFEGTIAENIARFGEIDPDKVIEATRLSGIHDMILRFPQGYDTPMGLAGNSLSGGQRQRIGLARALYGSPSFIVLDEPNANLDDVGEASLVRAVLEMKARGKTVLLITHRNNILNIADRILVLNDGKVQAYGPRQQFTAAAPQSAPPAAPGAASNIQPA